MENKNLYEILNLNPNSSKEEIKIAYRKLVRIYHPDVNQTKEAETYFKLLNNAAETLLDDAKRLQYDTLAGISRVKKDYVKNDETLKTKNSPENDKNAVDKTLKTRQEQEFTGNKTGETAKSTGFFTKKTSETFENKASNADKNLKNQYKGPKIDGKDIETIVNISKKEQKQGTVRKINVLHTDKCPKCAGAKYINGKVCALCHGVGEKSEHKKMNVKIPAGIKHGTKMKIQNEGEYGKFGGKNGDLYLLIQIENENVKKQPEFEDKNTVEDSVIETSITPWQAVLGGKITISVEGKNVSTAIPPLTKSGTRFKLKVDDEKWASLGLNADYTVIIRIDIDENLNKKEIELYKKLREIDLGLDS